MIDGRVLGDAYNTMWCVSLCQCFSLCCCTLRQFGPLLVPRRIFPCAFFKRLCFGLFFCLVFAHNSSGRLFPSKPPPSRCPRIGAAKPDQVTNHAHTLAIADSKQQQGAARCTAHWARRCGPSDRGIRPLLSAAPLTHSSLSFSLSVFSLRRRCLRLRGKCAAKGEVTTTGTRHSRHHKW